MCSVTPDSPCAIPGMLQFPSALRSVAGTGVGAAGQRSVIWGDGSYSVAS